MSSTEQQTSKMPVKDKTECKTCERQKGKYGPEHNGSSMCLMGSSIAAGGDRAHCTCDFCF